MTKLYFYCSIKANYKIRPSEGKLKKLHDFLSEITDQDLLILSLTLNELGTEQQINKINK
ncbi:hypothetical protein BpHYR1_048143 [Brachionus plicatilis]|uniref:Uncharacterized protein n=1 Tax=Brachionus plicatilis TaxID=10195 RepID=A0A3M7T0U5_BRAPC|nr:hypothetical protein BpHYR1_048143 [Brachionus plicatilis]